MQDSNSRDLTEDDEATSANRLNEDQLTFPFEISLISKEFSFRGSDVVIKGRFRHFGPESLTIMPNEFSIGALILSVDDNILLAESRFLVEQNPILRNEWVRVEVTVPKLPELDGRTVRLVVDLVREFHYWFRSKGGTPFESEIRFIQPNDRYEQTVLTKSVVTVEQNFGVSEEESGGDDNGLQVIFDVSDLIGYFQNARLPTGIQRVQIEVITNLIFEKDRDYDLVVSFFTKLTDTWRSLPLLFFNHICKLALVGGNTADEPWVRALSELRDQMESAKPLKFVKGAYLINLGTSWWLQNYFLHVRNAKARYNIRYVPYVHDCIPIITPEHCTEQLTRDFIAWALGAFQLADHVMVNSNATASDVVRVARHLGHKIDQPHVVTLDADYRAANKALGNESTHGLSDRFLQQGLREGGYFLFVSTIESRKNHLIAFSALLALIKKYGAQRVPKLVCVGNRGWLNDATYGKLDASKLLQSHVIMASKIPDPELEALYRNCLCTLYTSSYEGWGLPVTESLCFGKIPVLANSSSLPEAGGEFGEYFEPRSEDELIQKLERLIFDHDYRKEKERAIAERFRARPWADISRQIIGLVRQWRMGVRQHKEGLRINNTLSFPVRPGTYYGLTENLSSTIWSKMISGELFRQGESWWWPEPWGCWAKPGVARVSFVAPIPPGEDVVLYFGIRGIKERSNAIITLQGVEQRQLMLAPNQDQWLIFRIKLESLNKIRINDRNVFFDIMVSSDALEDFAASTNGVDSRKVSIGVRGFLLCRETDFASRIRFFEGVHLGDMQALTGKPTDEADFFG